MRFPYADPVTCGRLTLECQIKYTSPVGAMSLGDFPPPQKWEEARIEHDKHREQNPSTIYDGGYHLLSSRLLPAASVMSNREILPGEKNKKQTTYLLNSRSHIAYLESSHISRVSGGLQTVLVALEEEF